ncbi:hypothetical protein C7M23_01145 [Bacillus subtilis]|nr:hypothetical protein C7M23_01145 [Bacillus subtilis]
MRQNHLLADGFFYAKKGEHRNVYFRGEQEKSLQHCFLNKIRFGMHLHVRGNSMFGFNDMVKFLWSFLIVLPLVQIIHVSGHSFMAFIFGGKGSLDIGMGKTLLKIGPIRFRTIYFIDSFCRYGELKIDNRFSNALVYAGGCLFNLITIFAINLLIIHSVLKPNVFFYQFVYFSTYYVFFALLPVRYSEKKSSDGLAIYKVLRYGERYEIDK